MAYDEEREKMSSQVVGMMDRNADQFDPNHLISPPLSPSPNVSWQTSNMGLSALPGSLLDAVSRPVLDQLN